MRWRLLACYSSPLGLAIHTGQQTASRRQNWEYRVDAVPGTGRSVRMATEFDTPVMERNRVANERLINQRAAEGWELTAIGSNFYYFKRAK